MRLASKHQFYEVDSLPGCTQMAVSHSLFTPDKYRGKGLGKRGMLARLKQIEGLGYDCVMCTTSMSNKAQTFILMWTGWIIVHRFTSTKTGNVVSVWVKNINIKKETKWNNNYSVPLSSIGKAFTRYKNTISNKTYQIKDKLYGICLQSSILQMLLHR